MHVNGIHYSTQSKCLLKTVLIVQWSGNDAVSIIHPNIIQVVQLKSGPYFNMSNLFTKIYNMLYYTTNLYL